MAEEEASAAVNGDPVLEDQEEDGGIDFSAVLDLEDGDEVDMSRLEMRWMLHCDVIANSESFMVSGDEVDIGGKGGLPAKPVDHKWSFPIAEGLLRDNPGLATRTMETRIRSIYEHQARIDLERKARKLNQVDLYDVLAEMSPYLGDHCALRMGAQAYRQWCAEKSVWRRYFDYHVFLDTRLHAPSVLLINRDEVVWCLWEDPAPRLVLDRRDEDDRLWLAVEFQSDAAAKSGASLRIGGVR